jgi:hypothetical protein
MFAYQVAGKNIRCLLFTSIFSMAAAGQSRRHDQEMTVDHALMRALVSAEPTVRRGASSV